MSTVKSELTVNPSDGSEIVLETPLDSTYPYGGTLTIISDIPVNIQRYADVDARFITGGQPVTGDDVRVVLTRSSDCDAEDTSDVPTVEIGKEGQITVKSNATSDMSYLDPSWYDALWSYTSYWAGEFLTSSTIATIDITIDEENDSTLTEVETTNAAMEKAADETPAPDEDTSEVDATEGAAAADESEPDEDTSIETTEEAVKENEDSPGSTIRRSFLRQTVTTFVVLYATNAILVGVVGNVNPFGFGKVVVAAVAVSSLFSKKIKHLKNNQVQDVPRKLQSCTYNLDVLIDGCYNSFTINAPSARILDAVVENFTSSVNPEDQATTDYSAMLKFPVSENNTELLPNTTVPSLFCDMVVEGRPFIDITGKSLQASPVVEAVDSSWLGYLTEGKESASHIIFGNETANAQLLGDEWTRRALAEHASIASFSAFSIALMTNQAPSKLVEDALNAALDEVRHAKVSFDIASMLTGKEVGPGALPASNLDFHQDLTALALAVAREGCLDETLSTFSAALEAATIDAIMKGQVIDAKYSNVDHDTMVLMRDELNKIALEEGTHSALAWRTVSWICGVEPTACKTAYDEVFDENLLATRIRQVLPDKSSEVQQLIQEKWTDVMISHKIKLGLQIEGDEQPVCSKASTKSADLSGMLTISQLTASIQHGLTC